MHQLVVWAPGLFEQCARQWTKSQAWCTTSKTKPGFRRSLTYTYVLITGRWHSTARRVRQPPGRDECRQRKYCHPFRGGGALKNDMTPRAIGNRGSLLQAVPIMLFHSNSNTETQFTYCKSFARDFLMHTTFS